MNVIGPDISFYQDDQSTPQQVDFARMKSNGAGFVIIRAGQNLWIDPDLSYNWQKAKEAGLPRGSYWFYDNRVSPQSQAVKWISALPDLGELPLFADYEDGYWTPGPYDGWRSFKIFLEEVKRLAPNKEIGIYTRASYWNPQVPISEDAYFSQYCLWVAHYGATTPTLPRPWRTWTFWQYTETGDGLGYGVESRGIDLNFFNGDLNAFSARFGGTTTPPVEEGPMGMITYSNGVRVIEGTYNSWGFRCIVVPSASIQGVGFIKVQPRTVESIDSDLTWNWTPFDLQGNLNLGLRIGSVTVSAYRDFNPFAFWSAKKMLVAHAKTTFNATVTAGQGFRYLIERGVKNANANTDWNFRACRRVMATNGAGDTIILTTKGTSGLDVGLNLHEVCELLFSLGLGITYAVEGDGGGSAQDYLKVNGAQQVFRGDDNEIRNVPVYGVISLVSPCTGGTPPPAEVVPVRGWVEMSDGSTFAGTFTRQ